MESKIKAIIYGVGAMGSNIVRLAQSKPNIEIVGAVDRDPEKVNRDLGEVVGFRNKLGVIIQPPDQFDPSITRATLALHATTAYIDEAYDNISDLLKAKMNVVTITQELFFPVGKANRQKARKLGDLATEKKVTLSATGVNPGFIMDIVPSVCSAACWQIDSVTSIRKVDFSPYGPDEMIHIGANLTQDEFNKGVIEGTIGHIGLLETVAMVAHCIGIPIDELKQVKKPLITDHNRATRFVKIGIDRVYGFEQRVLGFKSEQIKLDFLMAGLLDPTLEERNELGDSTKIKGEPSVDLSIKREISQKGGLCTAASAINLIPRVLAAPPGYHTMNELSMPHFWPGNTNCDPVQNISYY